LRLFLLGALEDGPKHGYQLMRILEDRFAGLYRPSAGSIYPRLNALVDAGLVDHEGRDYSLTDEGRAEVTTRRSELRELESSIAAGRTRKRAGHALRAEVRAAAEDVRHQQRRVNRERKERTVTRTATLASLRAELRVFSADVVAATRRSQADAQAVQRVLKALDEARSSVLHALADN
jgi:DNA-binding PadR family transcriptional regulator